MRNRGIYRVVYRIANLSQYAIGICVGAIGGVLKIQEGSISDWPDWLERGVVWLQTHSPVFLIALPVLGGILQHTTRTIGSPRVWETVQMVLDELQSEIFSSQSDPLHHNRVTVFRIEPWHISLKPSSCARRCLVPVSRSGYTTQKTTTLFRIPDDADQAQGIAGRAWATKIGQSVHNLPDLENQDTDENVAEYARRTFVDEAWVRERRPKTRSVFAVTIEVKGRPWGVLVIDSRNPKKIQAKKHYNQIMMACKYLSRHVERV